MDIFEEVAQRVIRERKLNTTIDCAMPEHVATAAGYYSVGTDTVHVNIKMLSLGMEALFILLHELRHAEQYTYLDTFPPIVRQNLNYSIMYDGSAYKRNGSEWLKCRIDGTEDYLRELYLLSPMEIDANDFARAWLLEYAPELQADIERIYAFWRPPYRLIDRDRAEVIYREVFAFIDANASGSFCL